MWVRECGEEGAIKGSRTLLRNPHSTCTDQTAESRRRQSGPPWWRWEEWERWEEISFRVGRREVRMVDNSQDFGGEEKWS